MGASRSTPRVRVVSVLTTVVLTAVMISAMFVAPAVASNKTRLVSGLAGGSGSTVGPDGALYVTEGFAGRVSRVDPHTGAVTTFASGLPPSIVGIGGAMDVVFKGGTAYVLVTLVGEDVGGSDVVGIYRVDDPTHFTVIADIGAFTLAHPPTTSFFVPTGVQYAIESIRDFFLVTDGHHNRVYRVTLDGRVTERITLGNVVPTGLEVRHGIRYMSLAGPVPHRPEHGQIVKFRPGSRSVTEVARGGTASRGCGVRCRPPLRPGARAFHARQPGGFTRRPEHRKAPSGRRGRVHRRVVAPGPADLARVHRWRRLRRDHHWRDLEDRYLTEDIAAR